MGSTVCPASLSSHEMLQFFTGAVTNKVQVKVAIFLPHASGAATEFHLPYSNRSAGGQHSAGRVQSILQDAADVSERPGAGSPKT